MQVEVLPEHKWLQQLVGDAHLGRHPEQVPALNLAGEQQGVELVLDRRSNQRANGFDILRQPPLV